MKAETQQRESERTGRRRAMTRAACLLGCLVLTAFPVLAHNDYVDDQVIVGLLPATSIDTINARYGTFVLEHAPGSLDYLLGTVPGTNVVLLAQQMALDPEIDYAETNDVSETAEGVQTTTPSVDRSATSAMFHTQPAFNAVNGPQATAITKLSGIVVAVVDTGVHFANPELADNLSSNGYDFVDLDTDPSEVENGLDEDGDGAIDEGYGHGTHVAGLVALTAPGATILPIRVLDSEGRGSAFRVAEGIRHAIANGADVINLSLSIRKHSSIVAKAVREAIDAGITVVAAAGNAGVQGIDFPASESDVIAVAATDDSGVKMPFSNYGSAVVISAPGHDVLSSYDSTGYATWDGTSMATPIASGGAAMLVRRYPVLPPTDVLALVEQTAIDIAPQNPGFDGELGAGLVDLQGLATVAAANTQSVRMRRSTGGTVVDWEPYAGALSYDLIRGSVKALAISGLDVTLGTVTCLVNDTTTTDNSVSPDLSLPPSTDAFFYLMRPQIPSGGSPGYGTGSYDRPRVPAAGDCAP